MFTKVKTKNKKQKKGHYISLMSTVVHTVHVLQFNFLIC